MTRRTLWIVLAVAAVFAFGAVAGEKKGYWPAYESRGIGTRSAADLAPIAAFTGTPTTGPAPLEVRFTDTSGRNPTSWYWTFGTGQASTAQHPIFTFITPGTYTVELTATNASGYSVKRRVNYIVVTDGSTNIPPPPAPQFTTQASGDRYVAITMAGPGTSGFGGYKIYRSAYAVSDSMVLIATLPSPPAPAGEYTYYDFGLTNEQNYCYEVTAYNTEDEEGASSGIDCGFPQDTVAPGAVTIAASGTGTGNLIFWTASNAADFESYTLYRKVGLNAYAVLADSLTTRIYTDLTAPQATPCYYFVNVVDDDGLVSGNSDIVMAQWVAPAAGAPTGLIAFANVPAQGSATLSWTAPSDTTGFTSYSVYRSNVFEDPPTTVYKNGVAATTFADTNATVDSTFYYHVSAFYGATESDFSNVVVNTNTDITPPEAPTVVASATTNGIRLDWNAADGAVNYIVYRATTSDSTVLSNSVLGDTTDLTYLDTTAAIGTTYYYALDAVDGSDNRARSNVASMSWAPNTTPTGRVTSGLITLYEFDEGSGTTVTDSTATGLDLTIASAGAVTWGTGSLTVNSSTTIVSASGVAFNGAAEAADAATIELWVTPTSSNQGGPARIFAISPAAGGSSGNFTLGHGDNNGGLGSMVVTRKIGTLNNESAAGVMVAGQLVHLVYTKDASEIAKLYVNGVLVDTDTVADLSGWTDSNILSLANEPVGDRPWLGTFHLVATYEKALTAAEVLQNYDAGKDGNGATPAATPVVSFSANTVTGTAPLTVTFTGSAVSDSTITGWAWMFGDGGTSTNQNVAHTYNGAGSYTVTLSATSSVGTGTLTRSGYINVGSVSTGSPSISGVTGPVGSGQSITVAGANFGAKATAAPLVWETWDSESRWSAGQLDGSSVLTDANSFKFYKNYGGLDPVLSTEHARTTGNRHTRQGNVGDSYVGFNGINGVSGSELYVSGWFWGSEAGFTGGSHSFKGINISGYGTFGPDWGYPQLLYGGDDNGDGGTAGTSRWFGFMTTDSYQNLIPSSYGGSMFQGKWIRLEFYASLTANGTWRGWIDGAHSFQQTGHDMSDLVARYPLKMVQFSSYYGDNIPSPPTGGFWGHWDDIYVDTTRSRVELGNASTYAASTHREIQIPTAWSSAGNSITVTVNTGTFQTDDTAYLYVIDSSGNVSGGFQVTIGATGTTPPVVAPVAAFTGTPRTGNAPLTVQFTDQTTNTPTAWAWNFGDSETASTQSPEHEYAAAGTYTVSLTASNNSGAYSDVETKTGYVVVSAAAPSVPVADFTADDTTVTEGATVTFTDASTNSPTSWAWNFGAGESTTGNGVANPTHQYNTAGTYTVVLTATNASGSDTETKTGYITVSSPAAGPITSDEFTAGSLNTSLWTWENGRANSSYTQTGGALTLSVPAGTDHDLYNTDRNAAVITQDCTNADLVVEARFTSIPSQTYQFEGIIIQQDVDDYVRVDFVWDGALKIGAYKCEGGVSNAMWLASAIGGSPTSLRMKAVRSGNNFTFSYIADGSETWVDAGVVHAVAMTVSKIGVFGGNATGATSPAFGAVVDYFRDITP